MDPVGVPKRYVQLGRTLRQRSSEEMGEKMIHRWELFSPKRTFIQSLRASCLGILVSNRILPLLSKSHSQDKLHSKQDAENLKPVDRSLKQFSVIQLKTMPNDVKY